LEFLDIETYIIAGVIYIFLVMTIAKLGSYKSCGGLKAFFVSFLLTPIIGVAYVSFSPIKNVLKIVHYRCGNCGLDYTTSHNYCPSCEKEGKKHRLKKISMKTF
jgi:hypothetical protein